MKLAIRDNGQAAAYIRGKAGMSPEAFGRLPAELKAHAFSVARVTDFDVLRDLRDEIARLPQGGDWRAIRKTIAAKISPYLEEEEGGAPPKAARARAELILRTHGFQAYAHGRYRQQRATADALPYWQYLTVGDGGVREEHAALDGKVLPADDPFWDTHYPPWDFGCRCVVAAITREEADGMRDEDAGKDGADRRVVEGEALEELRAGTLDRGLRGKLDVRPPAERTGDAGAYSWSPRTLSVPLPRLLERYPEDMRKDFADALSRDRVETADGSEVGVDEFLRGEP